VFAYRLEEAALWRRGRTTRRAPGAHRGFPVSLDPADLKPYGLGYLWSCLPVRVRA